MINYTDLAKALASVGKAKPQLTEELRAEADRLAGRKRPEGEKGKGEETPEGQGKSETSQGLE